jgi:hypothetical protein
MSDKCRRKLQIGAISNLNFGGKQPLAQTAIFESTNFVILYRVTSSQKLSSGLDNARLDYLVLIWLV